MIHLTVDVTVLQASFERHLFLWAWKASSQIAAHLHNFPLAILNYSLWNKITLVGKNECKCVNVFSFQCLMAKQIQRRPLFVSQQMSSSAEIRRLNQHLSLEWHIIKVECTQTSIYTTVCHHWSSSEMLGCFSFSGAYCFFSAILVVYHSGLMLILVCHCE